MLVIYQSETGFAERYARWAAARMNADCLSLADAGWRRGEEAVLFGSVRADKIGGLRKARHRFRLQAVVAVGISPYSDGLCERLKKANGYDGALFSVQGGVDRSKLGWMQRRVLDAVSASLRTRGDEDLALVAREGGDLSSENQLLNFMVWWQSWSIQRNGSSAANAAASRVAARKKDEEGQ